MVEKSTCTRHNRINAIIENIKYKFKKYIRYESDVFSWRHCEGSSADGECNVGHRCYLAATHLFDNETDQ